MAAVSAADDDGEGAALAEGAGVLDQGVGSLWEEEIAIWAGREYGTGGERENAWAHAWGPRLASPFWLARVGQREREFGQPDGYGWLIC